MGNPAYELLELIDTWGDGGSLITRRNGKANTEDDLAFWDVQKQAMALLQEMEQFLEDQGAFDDEYRQAMTEVWGFLTSPRYDWCSSSDPHPQLQSPSRAMIRSIGAWMDKASVPITRLPSGHLEALRETLLELGEQLGEVTELPTEVRDHLLQLIGDALGLLDDEGTPLAQARAKTYEVVGAAIAVTLELPEEGRKSFFGRLLRLSGIWLSNMSAGAVGNVLAAGIDPTKLLGS